MLKRAGGGKRGAGWLAVKIFKLLYTYTIYLLHVQDSNLQSTYP